VEDGQFLVGLLDWLAEVCGSCGVVCGRANIEVSGVEGLLR
jgi:hypothetical protein